MATKKSKKSKKRRKKNSSDGTMKFLLVLVIAGLAIAMILFMQKEEEEGGDLSGTPGPTITSGEVTQGPTPSASLTNTPVPTATKKPEPTNEPTETPQKTLTPTPSPTEEPEPTPQVDVLGVEDAQKLVKSSVKSEYSVHLLNDHLWVEGKEYYQFYVLDKNSQMLYPFLIVDKLDGSLFCYDATENALLDFSRFPMESGVQGEDSGSDVTKTISAREAYEILCTYSKESLHIAKEVVSYDAEYGSELTLVNGTINCYRINLSEISDSGRVSNQGEFYISVDGTKCYYNDSETNEFVLVQK